ncbi:hypothetical protein PMAYCL1PPCAC_32655, partial [Pristionchus mayeri]
EAGLTIDDLLFGPSKLGIGYPVMHSEPYEPGLMRLLPPEMYIKKNIRVDFRKFDYEKKKLWRFQDVVYSIEFIKALSIYCSLDDCSKRALIASALACANFTSAYYSYAHNSDKPYYPDGF